MESVHTFNVYFGVYDQKAIKATQGCNSEEINYNISSHFITTSRTHLCSPSVSDRRT